MTVARKHREKSWLPSMSRKDPNSRLTATVLVLALIAWTGCSQPKFYPVHGEVVIFGVGKLTEGEVQFRPRARPDLIAKGTVQKNGSFALSTPGHGEGVLEGDCQAAVIVPQRNGKSVIAEKFADFDAADRNFTVTNRSENYWIIQVERAR
jgi:hypothetical protein